MAAVAGAGSRVITRPRLRGGAARAVIPHAPGATSLGSEAAVVSQPRGRPHVFPTMVFQCPLDACLASHLTTLAGATKAYISAHDAGWRHEGLH